jgi:cytochrome bd-type quinol oxidase subunit 2
MSFPSEPSFTLPQPPPQIAAELIRPPGQIKVFAIIHLVLAVYGFCTGIFGILSTLFFGKIMDMTQMGGNAAPAELQKMNDMMESLKPYNIMHAAFTLILAVMLLLAALSLLKNRDKGRKQSNFYAWTSIFFKVIYLLVNLFIIIPVTKAMTMSDLPPVSGQIATGIDLMVTIMPVISILVTFIYPIVALVMLNHREVRDFLAGR